MHHIWTYKTACCDQSHYHFSIKWILYPTTFFKNCPVVTAWESREAFWFITSSSYRHSFWISWIYVKKLKGKKSKGQKVKRLKNINIGTKWRKSVLKEGNFSPSKSFSTFCPSAFFFYHKSYFVKLSLLLGMTLRIILWVNVWYNGRLAELHAFFKMLPVVVWNYFSFDDIALESDLKPQNHSTTTLTSSEIEA